MANVKEIIQGMLKQGMSEPEVLSTLRDIGIANPEAVLKQAQESMKEVAVPTTAPVGKSKAPEIQEPEQTDTASKELFETENKVVDEREAEEPLPASQAISLPLPGSDQVEAKLDEALGLLRALQDINKKILDANRDILLRLKP